MNQGKHLQEKNEMLEKTSSEYSWNEYRRISKQPLGPRMNYPPLDN